MRMRSLHNTLVLVAGLVAATALPPAAALADAVPLHLELQIGSACVRGTKPNTQPIKVKLLRSDGKALDTAHDSTSSTDWGSLCFDRVPVAGNKLQIINGTDQDRTITVPDLTIVVDRVGSVVSGHAPAHKHVLISYRECSPWQCAELWVPLPATANVHGRYRRDLSSSDIDIDGMDAFTIDYLNGRGDLFSRLTFAPAISVVKPDQVSVYCAPQGSTSLRLLSPTGTVRATRSFHQARFCDGFTGSFRKDGHVVHIHTGDRITSDLATDARLTWPVVTVNGIGTTVSGRCGAHRRFGVLIADASDHTLYFGVTDSDGFFSSTTLWTFSPGDTLDLICETPAGDRVEVVRTL